MKHLFAMAVIIALQGCDQISTHVEEPKDGPFGIFMGMPLDELDRTEDPRLSLLGGLNSVPKPHPLIDNYSVRAMPHIGVCEIHFSTYFDTIQQRDRVFKLLLSQLTEKYGEPRISEYEGESIFGKKRVFGTDAFWDKHYYADADWGDIIWITFQKRASGDTKETATKSPGVRGEYRFSNIDNCIQGSSEIL